MTEFLDGEIDQPGDFFFFGDVALRKNDRAAQLLAQGIALVLLNIAKYHATAFLYKSACTGSTYAACRASEYRSFTT